MLNFSRQGNRESIIAGAIVPHFNVYEVFVMMKLEEIS
jgi:hypothetical protein